MGVSFDEMLNQIRGISTNPVQQGRLFEKVMKKFFKEDPVYKTRFSDVWLWSEFAAKSDEFSGQDTGIDLVAEEREGGYCAIQCKCYASDTIIQNSHIDSFISASASSQFSARILVDTGKEWGKNAHNRVKNVEPKLALLQEYHLKNREGWVWPNLKKDESPEKLRYEGKKFSLREHQRKALKDVVKGFEKSDRGKLIMACGTGKTFASLRMAEQLVGVGGRVLYLVPSISLLAQSMRKWLEQGKVKIDPFGICSDKSAGQGEDEDISFYQPEILVTTDPDKISLALNKNCKDGMRVVFSTYHSVELVAEAQDKGAPPFDLVICDEAHRTTGIEKVEEDGKVSPFVVVHDENRIRAKRRLYMTATPRIYAEGSKKKAKQKDIGLYSMDDEKKYGAEFHRFSFSDAVDEGILSDFRVVVLGVYEDQIDKMIGISKNDELNLSDKTKVVGSWRALENPENKEDGDETKRQLQRALVFTNTIKSSKRLADNWENVVRDAMPEEKWEDALRCEVKHVDGKDNALKRSNRIEWLRKGGGGMIERVDRTEPAVLFLM